MNQTLDAMVGLVDNSVAGVLVLVQLTLVRARNHCKMEQNDYKTK